MFHRGRQVHGAAEASRGDGQAPGGMQACLGGRPAAGGSLYAESFGSESAGGAPTAPPLLGDGEARAISALLVSGALPSLVLDPSGMPSALRALRPRPAPSDGHAPKLEELWLEDNPRGMMV